MTFEEFNTRLTQAVEKFEAQHLDEMSDTELFQAFHSRTKFLAELVAFEAKIRAELQRRAVAAQSN